MSLPNDRIKKMYMKSRIIVKENLIFFNRLHICNWISVRYSSLVKSSMGVLSRILRSVDALSLLEDGVKWLTNPMDRFERNVAVSSRLSTFLFLKPLNNSEPWGRILGFKISVHINPGVVSNLRSVSFGWQACLLVTPLT